MHDLFDTPATILSHHADIEAVDSFIAWRKKIKKPLTDRAAKMIAKTLATISDQRGDATEALDMTQERGWVTVKVAWYWEAKKREQSNRMAGGRASANPGVDEIAIAAAARRTPTKDCF